MGNCMSSQHHVRVVEDGGSKMHHKSKKRSIPHDSKHRASSNKNNASSSSATTNQLRKEEARPQHQDTTETSTSATDYADRELDATLPLSPDSTLTGSLLSPGSSMITPKRVDDSPGTEQPAVVFSLSDEKPIQHTSTRRNRRRKGGASASSHSYSLGTGHVRQGRALQARLQKARYMQMALSSTVSVGSDAGSYTSIPEDDDEGFTGLPLRYSMSNDTTNPKNTPASINDEFEASLNKGMIWAEVELHSPVLAVALSRQKPSLLRSTPPLFLAAGTESGMVTVTELLDDSPLTRSAARLGTTVTIQRQGRIRALDFSPDGSCLAVAGDDCVCTLARLDLRQDSDDDYGNGDDAMALLTRLTICAEIARVDRIYAIQFSPDGRFLAIGGFDGTVAIVATDQPTDPHLVVEIPTDGLVFCLDWSPDGRYLAIGGSDKCCLLVDAHESWQTFHSIRRPATVQTVQWHPNGRSLAIGSDDVIIVDRETFAIKHELDVRNSGSSTSNYDHHHHIHNSPTGGSAASSGSRRAVYRVNNVCWSPNGSYLVANGSDNCCKMLETKSYTVIHEIYRACTCISWGEQKIIAGIPHRYLAMGGQQDKKVVILKAGLEVHNGTSSVGGDDISSAASSYFSNRGDWVLKENAFKDVDEVVSSGSHARGGGRARANLKSQLQQQHSQGNGAGVVWAVAFSRGSRSRPSAFFAVATGDGLITIRSTLGWKIVSQMEFLNPTLCMAFSNGSRLLAMGGEDGRVRIAATSPLWSVIADINVQATVHSLAFSKNNERIAVGAGDGILTLLNPHDSFNIVGEIDESDSAILSVDWSSKHLALGRHDGSVQVFDSDNVYRCQHEPAARLTRRGPVRTVAFGASSRFLVTGGADGVIGVYSARGGWVLVHQIENQFGISTIRWSPSGRNLVFTGDSNQFKVIDTVFWADVEEAEKTIPASKTVVADEALGSGLSFSQDGKLLAVSGGQSGTRIVNTVSWDVVLTLSQPVAGEADDSSTSLSSPDDGNHSVGQISD